MMKMIIKLFIRLAESIRREIDDELFIMDSFYNQYT